MPKSKVESNLNRQIKKIIEEVYKNGYNRGLLRNDTYIEQEPKEFTTKAATSRLTALMEREIVKQAVKILEKRLNENEDRILKSYAARRAKGKK